VSEEDNKEELTTNQKKSQAQRKRWDRNAEITTGKHSDRRSKRYDFKCFEGIRLSAMQKEFVVRFMDPPYNGIRKNRYKAYLEAGFTASNDNSLKANCTAALNKSNIKEAILAYQKYALQNLKIEATSQNVDALRLRATYSVSDFYETDGTPKPLDKISPEMLVVIDDIDVDWKLSNKAEKKIIKYTLANREKAMKSLQEILGIMKTMETMEISVPVSSGKNAIENIGQNKDAGPRISMNITVGNPAKKDSDG
jgi:hypothetical protein